MPSRIRVTASVAALDAATDWLQLRTAPRNFFDISIAGTFSGTLTLERKRPGEADSSARGVKSFTAPTEEIAEMAGHWEVRLRMTGYTSGTAALELGV